MKLSRVCISDPPGVKLEKEKYGGNLIMRLNYRVLGIVLLAAILVTTVSIIGCPGPERRIYNNIARKFDQQPQITVYFNENKTKKTMPVEEYLLGVVAGEMKKDWPLEAYAAQAIVARTFTMEFISRGGTRKLHGTDISTDEKESQAYNAAAITPVIRRAVKMTEGTVMTYRGRYVKAWFHASSGGRTALATEGLAYKGKNPPYITSVSSPEEKVIPKEELFWTARFTSAEMAAALKKLGKSIGEVTRVEVGKRSDTSYRVIRLDFVGTKGRAGVHGADFRTAIGPEKMRSTWITDIVNEKGAITFKGRGFGHGVGMSQWGAHAMAKEGKTPNSIIKHYYPKVNLMKLW